MKKRKLKIMNILITVLVFIVLVILIVLGINSIKKDFKVVLNETEIRTGEDFKNDFKATFKGVDVTDNVKVEKNIDTSVAGIYEIKYTYKKGNKEYIVKKKITVIDNEKPIITLKGGNDIIVLVNSKYNEPGYVALDNSDGDITENVIVKGEVDTSKEGEYVVTYYVKDKSDNETEVTRKITVTTSSPLNMSIKDFTLDGLFESVTLKETEKASDEYIDNIIFAGDSMALYYVINEQIPGSQLWHQISITPETALTSPIYINHQDTNKTFVQNFEMYKPNMVIMTLGTNSAAYMSPEYFYEKYTELVKQIKKASPKTKLIIQSVPPVDKEWDSSTNGINNDKINKLNYYIGKMCEELDVKFLNSAPILKDENGQCKTGYCSSDGIHLTKKGQEQLMEYAKTHMYK